MAGGYLSCMGKHGFFDFECIENLGDAHEACEELYYMINRLAHGLSRVSGLDEKEILDEAMDFADRYICRHDGYTQEMKFQKIYETSESMSRLNMKSWDEYGEYDENGELISDDSEDNEGW